MLAKIVSGIAILSTLVIAAPSFSEEIGGDAQKVKRQSSRTYTGPQYTGTVRAAPAYREPSFFRLYSNEPYINGSNDILLDKSENK